MKRKVRIQIPGLLPMHVEGKVQPTPKLLRSRIMKLQHLMNLYRKIHMRLMTISPQRRFYRRMITVMRTRPLTLQKRMMVTIPVLPIRLLELGQQMIVLEIAQVIRNISM